LFEFLIGYLSGCSVSSWFVGRC